MTLCPGNGCSYPFISAWMAKGLGVVRLTDADTWLTIKLGPSRNSYNVLSFSSWTACSKTIPSLSRFVGNRRKPFIRWLTCKTLSRSSSKNDKGAGSRYSHQSINRTRCLRVPIRRFVSLGFLSSLAPLLQCSFPPSEHHFTNIQLPKR